MSSTQGKERSEEEGKSKKEARSRADWNRRLARCGIAVLLAGLLAAGAFVYFSERQGGKALAISDPIPPPLPEPGSARPWEAQIQVSTYSSLHTRNANLLTTIPIVGWSGRGPAMSMVFYHNAANVDSNLPLTAGMGFDLGPGWTTSYSSILILDDPQTPTTITTIADDGTQTVFGWNAGAWWKPRGIYDELSGEPDARIGPTFTLKHKDQSFEEYELIGDTALLTKVVDATYACLTHPGVDAQPAQGRKKEQTVLRLPPSASSKPS